jgi:hypothetical protein
MEMSPHSILKILCFSFFGKPIGRKNRQSIMQSSQRKTLTNFMIFRVMNSGLSIRLKTIYHPIKFAYKSLWHFEATSVNIGFLPDGTNKNRFGYAALPVFCNITNNFTTTRRMTDVYSI